MKRITIKRVKQFMVDGGLTHVVMFGYDGNRSWVGTHGKTLVQAVQAAEIGNKFKDLLNWPECLHAYPRRLKLLEARLKRAEACIDMLEAGIKDRDMAIADLQADNEAKDER